MKIKATFFLLVAGLLLCNGDIVAKNKQGKRYRGVGERGIQEEILEGFPGVNDLFSQLSGVQGILNASTQAYQQQNEYMDTFKDEFDERKKLREETYQCVLAKYDAFEEALGVCLSNKDEVIRDIELDKRILEGQIQDLTKCASQEIAILQEQVDSLEEQIDQVKKYYASISHMSKENVDEAVKELESIRNQYGDMVTIRTEFLKNLDTLLKELEVAELSEERDTLYLENEICGS